MSDTESDTEIEPTPKKIRLTPSKKANCKRCLFDSDSEEDRDFSYDNFDQNEVEKYVKQMPFPLKGLLKVRSPVKLKNGMWRNYCACNKPGIDRDGETYCNSELSESDQYDIVQKFWEHFNKESLEEFVTWATEATGRAFVFPEGSQLRLGNNYVALLLFYVMPFCHTALRLSDLVSYVGKMREQGKKQAYPKFLYLPFCLADDHLLFSTGEKKRVASRLLKTTNQFMLCKFLFNLNSAKDPEKRVYNLTLKQHAERLTKLGEEVKMFCETGADFIERSYTVKLHNCNKNDKLELCVVTMCDMCKRNNEMVVSLKDVPENNFLR